MPYWVVSEFRGDLYYEPYKTKAEANRAAWHEDSHLSQSDGQSHHVYVMQAPMDKEATKKNPYPDFDREKDVKNGYDNKVPYQNLDQGAYILRDKETGNLIEGFKTLVEAKAALKKAEQEDKDNDEYEEDFYEIAKRNTKGTYDTYVPPVKQPKAPKLGYKMPTQSQLSRGCRR